MPSAPRSALDETGPTERDTAAVLSALLLFALAFTSSVVPLGYEWLAHPDRGDLRAQLRQLDKGMLLTFGLVLSLVNAVTEEVAYRGVLQHALESEFGVGLLALALQGVAFAAPHYGHGFPRGPVGLVLTAAYGIALGILRRWARGLLAPSAAHVVADMTIFAIVLRSAA
jgi:membrane protease YdiL (CAAX protease family)